MLIIVVRRSEITQEKILIQTYIWFASRVRCPIEESHCHTLPLADVVEKKQKKTPPLDTEKLSVDHFSVSIEVCQSRAKDLGHMENCRQPRRRRDVKQEDGAAAAAGGRKRSRRSLGWSNKSSECLHSSLPVGRIKSRSPAQRSIRELWVIRDYSPL